MVLYYCSQIADIQTLAANANASAIFLPGYPVTQQQLDSFNAQVFFYVFQHVNNKCTK